jgi:hypothetical protein
VKTSSFHCIFGAATNYGLNCKIKTLSPTKITGLHNRLLVSHVVILHLTHSEVEHVHESSDTALHATCKLCVQSMHLFACNCEVMGVGLQPGSLLAD